jgi:hypothetical protein
MFSFKILRFIKKNIKASEGTCIKQRFALPSCTLDLLISRLLIRVSRNSYYATEAQKQENIGAI